MFDIRKVMPIKFWHFWHLKIGLYDVWNNCIINTAWNKRYWLENGNFFWQFMMKLEKLDNLFSFDSLLKRRIWKKMWILKFLIVVKFNVKNVWQLKKTKTILPVENYFWNSCTSNNLKPKHIRLKVWRISTFFIKFWIYIEESYRYFDVLIPKICKFWILKLNLTILNQNFWQAHVFSYIFKQMTLILRYWLRYVNILRTSISIFMKFWIKIQENIEF